MPLLINKLHNIIYVLDFILTPCIFNSKRKQATRMAHTTAKSTAAVVEEIAQSAGYNQDK